MSGKGSGDRADETRLPTYCNSCKTIMDTLWSVILFLLLWESVKIKYQKPTASILLNGETWDVFPSRTLTITSFKDSTGGSGQHYLVKGKKKERRKEDIQELKWKTLTGLYL